MNCAQVRSDHCRENAKPFLAKTFATNFALTASLHVQNFCHSFLDTRVYEAYDRWTLALISSFEIHDASGLEAFAENLVRTNGRNWGVPSRGPESGKGWCLVRCVWVCVMYLTHSILYIFLLVRWDHQRNVNNTQIKMMIIIIIIYDDHCQDDDQLSSWPKADPDLRLDQDLHCSSCPPRASTAFVSPSASNLWFG